jgi:excisionase family DNA binding protein
MAKEEIELKDRLAYSTADAAMALSVSRSVVCELVRTGELAHFRIGRRVLISRDELIRFMALREEENRLGKRAHEQIELRIEHLRKLQKGLPPVA